jgi:predicted DNA-binding ribbon-helix-helix protein
MKLSNGVVGSARMPGIEGALPKCWPSQKGTFLGIWLLLEAPNHDSMETGCGGTMKSTIVKHSIVIDGHKTSVSLEDAFWSELKEIAHTQQATLSALVAKIDETRQHGNLSSAIRLYVLEYFRTRGLSNDPGEGRRKRPAA